MNNVKNTAKQLQIMSEAPDVKKRLQEILGKNQETFVSSMIQVVNQNSMLKNADANTVLSAAMMAATLHMPLNNNLGFAYIVPFYNGKKQITEAQFQLGYKGFIQLAQRTGQMKTISVACVYEGQLISKDPLKGYVFNWDTEPSEGSRPIGYVAYMKLINGFEATNYMTFSEIEKHAKQYSQSFRKESGPWKDHFDEMAQKTVLKSLLSKYAPLSVELQTAVTNDQAVIRDDNPDYIDNKDDKIIDFLTTEQLQELSNIIADNPDKEQMIKDAFAVESVSELTKAEANEALGMIKAAA